MKFILTLLTHLILLMSCIDGANILILTPLGSKSHLSGFKGMFQQLAERGHRITFVSAFPSSKKKNNIRDVVVPVNLTAIKLVRNVFTDGILKLSVKMLTETPYMCSENLASDNVQYLKKEKFDLVLLSPFMSDCYLSLVHHFQAPLIYVSPAGFVSILSELVGRPYFISIEGNIILDGIPPYGFIYRLKATLIDFIFNSVVKYYTNVRMESVCRERGLCPPNMPSFDDIRANSSLAIANSVKLLQPNPHPEMPNIIYGGGSHCEPSKPLPKDLEKWVQESGEHGFIFFSLGSALTPSDMPEKARKTFLKVFGKLKQNVLWKWDKDMDDVPSNVKLGKWLPQQDILGHPQLKLFISHGGTHSIMETTYHGARILGMPVFGDQHGNIIQGVRAGWAECLHWEDLTEKALETKINTALNNNEMTKIVSQRAKIMNDQPRPPKEEVAYWIEYVLRHNGAPHLRSPVHHMPLYVLYNMDVWLTILSFLAGMLCIFSFIIRSLFKLVCTTKSINKRKKKE